MYFYCPQLSWGKVILSQASVILSTEGVCMVAWGCVVGGVHGCGGYVVGGRACVAGGRHAWQGDRGMHVTHTPVYILRLWHTVNERAVRILILSSADNFSLENPLE